MIRHTWPLLCGTYSTAVLCYTRWWTARRKHEGRGVVVNQAAGYVLTEWTPGEHDPELITAACELQRAIAAAGPDDRAFAIDRLRSLARRLSERRDA
jgi:hypothetical protein